jgi:hypothetical protein
MIDNLLVWNVWKVFLNHALISSKNGGRSFVAHAVNPLHFICIDEVSWFLVYILGWLSIHAYTTIIELLKVFKPFTLFIQSFPPIAHYPEENQLGTLSRVGWIRLNPLAPCKANVNSFVDLNGVDWSFQG